MSITPTLKGAGLNREISFNLYYNMEEFVEVEEPTEYIFDNN